MEEKDLERYNLAKEQIEQVVRRAINPAAFRVYLPRGYLDESSQVRVEITDAEEFDASDEDIHIGVAQSLLRMSEKLAAASQAIYAEFFPAMKVDRPPAGPGEFPINEQ